MRFLFLFLDGVGLGADDPLINPFARASLPNLEGLLGGRKFIAATAPYVGPDASLIALDPNLGVSGLPQSATGQAVLLTGVNIPAAIGYHYGPKPNEEVAFYLRNGNLFSRLKARGRTAALLSAYPPRYFEGIANGRRIYSAIPLAATSAGLSLMTIQDLRSGAALAADFTAQGWREHLGMTDVPVITPEQAGVRLAQIAASYDFTLFEYWISDYAGHHQDMDSAVSLLETIDRVLGALAASWENDAGLVLLTSDHGNLEDLSTRRHTANPVPALLIGSASMRGQFASSVTSLSDVAPAILALEGEADFPGSGGGL